MSKHGILLVELLTALETYFGKSSSCDVGTAILNHPQFLPSMDWIETIKLRVDCYMEVSINGGTPKTSIYRWIFPLNHPFWVSPFVETPIYYFPLALPISDISSWFPASKHRPFFPDYSG